MNDNVAPYRLDVNIGNCLLTAYNLLTYIINLKDDTVNVVFTAGFCCPQVTPQKICYFRFKYQLLKKQQSMLKLDKIHPWVLFSKSLTLKNPAPAGPCGCDYQIGLTVTWQHVQTAQIRHHSLIQLNPDK